MVQKWLHRADQTHILYIFRFTYSNINTINDLSGFDMLDFAVIV